MPPSLWGPPLRVSPHSHSTSFSPAGAKGGISIAKPNRWALPVRGRCPAVRPAVSRNLTATPLLRPHILPGTEKNIHMITVRYIYIYRDDRFKQWPFQLFQASVKTLEPFLAPQFLPSGQDPLSIAAGELCNTCQLHPHLAEVRNRRVQKCGTYM